MRYSSHHRQILVYYYFYLLEILNYSFNQNGISCDVISKVGEGRPNIVDYIKNGDVQFIINTPLGQKSRYDEYEIGKSAIRHKITATTTIAGAQAALRAIRRIKNNKMDYRSLQDIFSSIRKRYN